MSKGLLSTLVRRYAGATPIEGDGHVDRPLSNLAISAFNSPGEGLIGDQIFPSIPVDNQSDKYFIIEKDAFRRIPDMSRRAPGTSARRVQFVVSCDAFYCDNYALATETPLEFIANAEAAIRFRQNNTRLVVTQLQLEQEVRIARLVTSISNVGSGVQLTGTSKWSDFANSDPLGDVNTGHAFIRMQTGLLPNTAIIDWDTAMILRRHPRVLDMFKAVQGGEATMANLAELFKVSRVLVPQAIVQNENESSATSTMSATNVWGNNVVLAHLGASTGLESQTLGLRFRWSPPIFPAGMAVAIGQETQAGGKKVEIVEAGYYQAEKIVARDLGYVIQNTL